MSKFLILGGKQKSSTDAYTTPEWKGYERGIALELNYRNGISEITQAFDYISPATNRNETEDASVLFKAGQIHKDNIVVCTQTEVLIYSINNYQLKKVISLPCFNDLHHARLAKNGNLLVVATGLDALFEVTLEGDIINEWPVSDFKLWDRFDKNTDYRKLLTTKPHSNHPNYCFETTEGTWVTRHVDKDAICLQTGTRINIEVGGPHDGELYDGKVYFTTVNAKLVCSSLENTAQTTVYDLGDIGDKELNLGWCRALQAINSDEFLVGFSRLRPSKYHEYTRWIKKKLKKDAYAGNLPTRISHYNIQKKTLNTEINLEEHGMNCVFSILAMP